VSAVKALVKCLTGDVGQMGWINCQQSRGYRGRSPIYGLDIWTIGDCNIWTRGDSNIDVYIEPTRLMLSKWVGVGSQSLKIRTFWFLNLTVCISPVHACNASFLDLPCWSTAFVIRHQTSAFAGSVTLPQYIWPSCLPCCWTDVLELIGRWTANLVEQQAAVKTVLFASI